MFASASHAGVAWGALDRPPRGIYIYIYMVEMGRYSELRRIVNRGADVSLLEKSIFAGENPVFHLQSSVHGICSKDPYRNYPPHYIYIYMYFFLGACSA